MKQRRDNQEKVRKVSGLGETKKFRFSKMKLKANLTFHNNIVNNLCILSDGRLASCSDDWSICIYNFEESKVDLKLEGHSKEVTYIFEFKENVLLSSSWDNTVKIWEISGTKYSCIGTLLGHEFCVFKVIGLSNNRICSCSYDNSIKVWDGINFCCIETLTQHNDKVTCIIELKNKKHLVSSSEDRTLRFWCNSTYECVKVIDDIYCYSNNSLIEISRSKILAGGETLSVIDASTLQLEMKIINSELQFIYAIGEFKDDTVICSINKSLILINSDSYNKIDEKVNLHKDYISSFVMVRNAYLITSSADKTIKIWDN